VADASRSILDGHIVLTRRLASAGHYPAIDILDSKSRVRDHVITRAQRDNAGMVQRLEAAYREKEDLILVGAYQRGSNALVDAALDLRGPMLDLLQQPPEDYTPIDRTVQLLQDIGQRASAAVPRPGSAPKPIIPTNPAMPSAARMPS
jgi:flagellum-specific ATP synthase